MEDPSSICICVLAHNEEKHIESTIEGLVQSCGDHNIDIKIYVNGCTDLTIQIVKKLQKRLPNLYLIELSEASKTKAWNRAFTDNQHEFLIFSDGDILPGLSCIKSIVSTLSNNHNLIICGCTLWPLFKEMSFAKFVVGVLQIPVFQDFLSGGLYGLRREKIKSSFAKYNLTGIPDFIIGEDFFLNYCLNKDQLFIHKDKVFYEPPQFKDYKKYLARIKWQKDQIAKTMPQDEQNQNQRIWLRIMMKLKGMRNPLRFSIGCVSSSVRSLYKLIYRDEIDLIYKSLGSNFFDGNFVLLETRSTSTK